MLGKCGIKNVTGKWFWKKYKMTHWISNIFDIKLDGTLEIQHVLERFAKLNYVIIVYWIWQ